MGEVAVVRPTLQVSHTVAVGVAVSAPEPAGIGGGTAGALSCLSVTVLSANINTVSLHLPLTLIEQVKYLSLEHLESNQYLP